MKRFVAGILFFFLYSTLSIAQKYTVTDLGTLAGGSNAGAAINASGEIAGESTLDGSNRAILYSNGTMTNLGTLGGNGSGASGLMIRRQAVSTPFPPSAPFH